MSMLSEALLMSLGPGVVQLNSVEAGLKYHNIEIISQICW